MKVLFVFGEDATFVRTDREILRGFAEVSSFRAGPGRGLLDIAPAVARHDIVFIWFGLGHASRAVLAARFLGKPSILVGGGWDVADMPEIEYGAARGLYGRTRASITFGFASKVLAFSEWSADAIRRLSPRSRVEPVYLGIDPERWVPAPEKEPIVLSVGNVSNTNLRRKGLETFAKTSRLVPESRFVLVGRQEPGVPPYLASIGGPNLELVGELSDEELRGIAGRSTVYVQASHTEGFGLAVAEAMSAGCVPVVTRVGALPEVVGDCGLYVPESRPESTAEAIRRAMRSGLGPNARRRVAERFTIAARSTAIRRVVARLASGS